MEQELILSTEFTGAGPHSPFPYSTAHAHFHYNSLLPAMWHSGSWASIARAGQNVADSLPPHLIFHRNLQWTVFPTGLR